MNSRRSCLASVLLLCAIALPFLGAASADRAVKSSLPGSANRNSSAREIADPDVSTGPSAAKLALERSRSQPASSDYVLQPQDIIKVHVFQQEDINKQCESIGISHQRTIQLPMIGVLLVQEKTARQLEVVIRDAYIQGGIFVDPQVSVTVVKYADRGVSVLGNVKDPGRILFPPERKITILEAIAAAGGATRYGDLKKVTLTRRKGNGEPEAKVIDVAAMMKPGAPDAVVLEQDDVINVPERVI